MEPEEVMWLNGFTCLACAWGWYDGYDMSKGLTMPCNRCGHQAPQTLTVAEFHRIVAERDRKLFPEVMEQ